ncbi:MAG: hypothetical protein AB2421_19220 [Thermotaleaceae bacterium]
MEAERRQSSRPLSANPCHKNGTSFSFFINAENPITPNAFFEK